MTLRLLCATVVSNHFEVSSLNLYLKIRPLGGFSGESGTIKQKYPQGMSILSEHSITRRKRISC